ncbi:MBOAT family protein, partial [Turicibacter sanguinis]|nr:MBOAT family protein [Turicibacter sanguinis]
MVFSSLFFMFIFFPIVFLAYFLMPRRGRNLVLLIASLVFYAWGEPKYIVLMLLSIVVNYVLVLLMEKNPNQKKILFMVALLFNLGLLGFFKYYDFFIENVNYLFHLSLEGQHIPLPIGISFYTFQILSYVIDAYTGKTKAQQNIISFALYVTMFPQLVAGPIVKYTDIQIQLSERQESFEKIGLGAERFIAGLAKKVLLANTIGYLFTTIQEMEFGSLSVLTAWLGMIAFTLQIYFDFSGYSDMAIGLGKMFGFDFLENFNDPYISKSVTEFWRRWHMSLGGWFREYVYIPLGGNRLGIKKQIRNLLIVWLLTGLWHGASWNF